MNWWKLPLTVLGLGGVGAVVLASRSRRSTANSAAKQLKHWNEAAQQELLRLQDHLRELAATVNPGRAS
jgi:cytochrome c-type biogenesis protein CcmH/NrfF